MVAAVDYTVEVLTKGPRRISASTQTAHIPGSIGDSSANESNLPTEEYLGYTWICAECHPTRLTVHLPTHGSTEFYQKSAGRQTWKLQHL